MNLNFDMTLEQLYTRAGLLALDLHFLQEMEAADPLLLVQLQQARLQPEALTPLQESHLLLALGPHVEDFIARLFRIEAQVNDLSQSHHALAPLHAIKRKFVQRTAARKISAEQAASIDGAALRRSLHNWFGGQFDELTFATQVQAWLEDAVGNAEKIDCAVHYAAWAFHTAEGQSAHRGDILFRPVHAVDDAHLVPGAQALDQDGYRIFSIKPSQLRQRQGFALTDAGCDLRGALDQANYCIWCHAQGKDSCSHGLPEKTPKDAPPLRGKAAYKRTVFGVTQTGCPLSEKISEFQTLKAGGHALAALAMITVDNPMAAATGHRICNDCMKSCIYQKQEPVNIPEVESRTIKDVLALPYGFEIYSLLTRWNPLNLRRPYPRARSGYRVLVTGLGPAGYTLAHQLLNDGHTVVGIDGLKVEPLPESISGVRTDGSRTAFMPITNVEELFEALDERIPAGFGGVAEYGITVRWNKNFLKVVRLLLERRPEFSMFGGVRFGGTMTAEDAFRIGFDHIALALGAGRPTVLDIPNGLARGVRTASDFLMALQLSGAAKADSLANMQLRLPVVVIGGGLTGIDTATEALAYYPVQVEKFMRRHEQLCAERSAAKVRAGWSAEDTEIAEEFLQHAAAIRTERLRAAAIGETPDILALLRGWGGVTLAYRKRMIDSPAYTLNHEEIEKALEEGIAYAECLGPVAIEVDAQGAANAIRMQVQQRDTDGNWSDGEQLTLPARAIFIAAGTSPNTVLAREDATHFRLDGRYFAACDEQGEPLRPEHAISKPARAEVLLSKTAGGKFVSYFGDLHPSFSGNVVKAMASAKQGYPLVSRVLAQQAPANTDDDASFFSRLNAGLRATVHAVNRLTPTIVEVVLHAPFAAAQFRPGQFFRLQNYESRSPLVRGTRMSMEGLALTGAWVDVQRGLVACIVLEMGGSANLVATLQAGEPVVLMGPTGAPTHIAANETVMLVGGGLGNAVLFSIGAAFRAAGSRVLYFAGYKKCVDRYKVAEIEAAADVIVWCCDEAPGFSPGRPQDKHFVGNIVQAILAYASGGLGDRPIDTGAVDRLIAIGSDRMMAAIALARHNELKPYMKAGHFAIGSINSPMQCMMKEICAQCLQPQRDPETGKINYVFTCFDQDQPLDNVDFSGLNARLRQNSLQEKLTAQWIDSCMHHGDQPLLARS
ncbi:FAD-dependent oxidoreductase [Herminiimonas sp. CN]|uniref:FAD-dependent oxidoreductase n=1 Tax=Herminiimonas sp. CN TaxID=1349818 RepID=UPI001930968E|nr:FAD-dependent oxidoreductase [Herminiimonas sp. CN]